MRVKLKLRIRKQRMTVISEALLYLWLFFNAFPLPFSSFFFSMSKEYLALQCVGCGAFQVQQNKKSKKYVCVLCRMKQSIGKVFFRGSIAKEVRPVVQQLNMQRGKRIDEEKRKIGKKDHEEETGQEEPLGGDSFSSEKLSFQASAIDFEDVSVAGVKEKKRSKWEDFLEDAAMEETRNDEDHDLQVDPLNNRQFATCVPDAVKNRKLRKTSGDGKETVPPTLQSKGACKGHDDDDDDVAFDKAFESAFGSN
eukprot:TRINITY_DN626_c2_g1_i2.p1 TRINITY_DN626_c2_g1~~TRINITY_DN626_c2_g1_i2.p1  ORF type:complete len:252 (-),score=85.29 TRINITY_DN626_c2_g1_i2:843-1598(-)